MVSWRSQLNFLVLFGFEPFQLSCLAVLISFMCAGLDIPGILLFRTLIGKVR